jgi:response regulator RpfG family c-di-GMP phosphodiesterase
MYRKAMSHQEVVTELRRYAGTLYGPDLVEKYISSFGMTGKMTIQLTAPVNALHPNIRLI